MVPPSDVSAAGDTLPAVADKSIFEVIAFISGAISETASFNRKNRSSHAMYSCWMPRWLSMIRLTVGLSVGSETGFRPA